MNEGENEYVNNCKTLVLKPSLITPVRHILNDKQIDKMWTSNFMSSLS